MMSKLSIDNCVVWGIPVMPAHSPDRASASQRALRIYPSAQAASAFSWLRSTLFESELRAPGLEWASKKACWFSKPQAVPIHAVPQREPWDLDRSRSAYAYRPA